MDQEFLPLLSPVQRLGGPEVFGASPNTAPVNGTLSQTITGASDGAGDQAQSGGRVIGGDLSLVSTFNGTNGVEIGSASAVVLAGFGDGADLFTSVSDAGNVDTDFANRSHLIYASFAAAAVPEPSSTILLTGLCGLVAARRRRS